MKKLLLALVLSVAPGCASAGDYFLNRGGDIADILRLHVAVGKAASVKVDAFRLIHVGIGWESEAWAWGLANREVTAWRESVFTWGLILGHHQEQITGTSQGQISGSYGWTFNDSGNAFEMGDKENWLDLLSARAQVMLGLGLDVDFRIGEILDFLVGIFQFDPAGDDVRVSALRTPK